MNCEKCKNRKATVFFADDGGGRHALCAACGATQGKLGQITPNDTKDTASSLFLPSPSLISLSPLPLSINPYVISGDGQTACPVCKTSANDLIGSHRLGCVTCYTVFADLLPLRPKPQEADDLGRMPRSNRARRDKQASIARFRSEIKKAIEEENYELAATLRDKIKKLEASAV